MDFFKSIQKQCLLIWHNKLFDRFSFIPRWSGVLPPAESAVGASNSALASIRQLTHSKWPREAAMCKGVSPSYIMTQKRKTKVMNINEWQSNSYKSSLVAKIKVDIKRGKRIRHVGLPLLIYSAIMFSYFHIQTRYGLKLRRQTFRTKMMSIKLTSEQEFCKLYFNVKSICERYIYTV